MKKLVNAEEIYNKTINVYGKEAQMYKLTEECGEYITALNQFKDGRITISDLIEELVDIDVLIDQMKIIFEDRISEWYHIKERKLKRLRDRINGKDC